MRRLIATASLFALAACGLNGTDRYAEGEGAGEKSAAAPANATMGSDNLADPMASRDGQQIAGDIPDPEQRPIMQAQVALDRVGFMPGVVDGKMGMSTVNALKGFQEANGLDVTGELDDATKAKMAQWQNIPATRVVTIPADWGNGPYYAMPAKPEDQAKMQQLGYTSLDERLAERFHTTVETLKALNPGGRPAGARCPAPPSLAGPRRPRRRRARTAARRTPSAAPGRRGRASGPTRARSGNCCLSLIHI